MTNKKFDRLFDGPPRKKEAQLTQRDMDLARSVQEVTEEVMRRMARHAKHVTGSDYLCLAGGVALNCVANGKILRENLFKDIWIQPAAGDAGGALGAALGVWHWMLEKEKGKSKKEKDGNRDLQRGSFLGPGFSDVQIRDFLNDNGIPFKEQSDDELFRRVAQILADEKVVGWFRGPMEFGPRALGSRSILGDARSEKMQREMNLKIKFRESFRPFAPAVLAEEVENYFEIDRPSPYMLLVAEVKKERQRPLNGEEQKLSGLHKLNVSRSQIPAVTHVDCSARIQTVHEDTNPDFYRLLSEFQRQTGCPVLINTSFNVRGEPIVCTPENAYKCFMRTNMDFLVLGGFLLDKKEQPEFHEAIDWREEFEPD
jgi:carbamoyltransferase